MLHHDNALAHASLLIRSYLAKHHIRCAPSTLLSGLIPSKIFPISQTKNQFERSRFQTIEEIRENAIRELRAITESAFQETFQQWKKRWERCIASRADCCEGDSA